MRTRSECIGLCRPSSPGGIHTSLADPDRQSEANFIREHAPALHAIAFRLCGDLHDAHDLVQDTLERAWRRFTRDKSGDLNSRPWLMSILHNLFIDRCRAKARDRRLLSSSEGLDTAGAHLAEPEGEAVSLWESVTGDELRAAVDRLSEKFRIVYTLHTVERRSYKEIAETLSISQATVGTRLIRARRRLKEMLIGEGRRRPK